ncbi:bifunctional demethylmenaquinone methyltransferase/2-methoxy-6-polyprenyl-1,4-benzoquinol methylase UbiE [uncultured Gimesia sp.]|uniref:bifunctional demethylmenaquinone methyltransferase/2-methoxy-6-polyprenyl-1,4-benzoquinol methylase UbiE n=1 Tax=uncultured Gimesia sp. TaxID=1678688 RepID=UPI00263803D7|nr:bifunctional demethylmenaquinone methyltransferase/2-methoxy-6-polyprenyl-1,4-benzoquinol methylase UbiE [uncultured Gimesia sp.]
MNVDKTGSRVQQMFGEIAPRYDFMNHFLSGGVDYYWRWRTVRKVMPQGNAPILDVCTGTGDLAISYLNKTGGKTQVVGADFTHEMLELALKKNSNELLTFLEADTQQLPFADNQFQIVSVAFGLRNVADTSQGLKEMIRVCQPGGQVAVLEFSMPTNRLFRACYQFYFRHILPKIGQLLARNKESAYNYLPESVSEFPHGKELATLMDECGLTGTRWYPLTFGIATLYAGTKPTTAEQTTETTDSE